MNCFWDWTASLCISGLAWLIKTTVNCYPEPNGKLPSVFTEERFDVTLSVWFSSRLYTLEAFRNATFTHGVICCQRQHQILSDMNLPVKELQLQSRALTNSWLPMWIVRVFTTDVLSPAMWTPCFHTPMGHVYHNSFIERGLWRCLFFTEPTQNV